MFNTEQWICEESSSEANVNNNNKTPRRCQRQMGLKLYIPWERGSWGQHGSHLGPTGPRWAPCWPYELCYLGNLVYSWCRNVDTWYWSCTFSLFGGPRQTYLICSTQRAHLPCSQITKWVSSSDSSLTECRQCGPMCWSLKWAGFCSWWLLHKVTDRGKRVCFIC